MGKTEQQTPRGPVGAGSKAPRADGSGGPAEEDAIRLKVARMAAAEDLLRLATQQRAAFCRRHLMSLSLMIDGGEARSNRDRMESEQPIGPSRPTGGRPLRPKAA